MLEDYFIIQMLIVMVTFLAPDLSLKVKDQDHFGYGGFGSWPWSK